MNNTNTNTEFYATIARINAAIIANKVERDEWLRDYDRKNQRAEW